jgi:hypothetical protein
MLIRILRRSVDYLEQYKGTLTDDGMEIGLEKKKH